MIESLDEAIKHCEATVSKLNARIDFYNANDMKECVPNCKACAEEHEQLAEWLKELKDYRTRTCEFCKHEDKAETDFPCSICRCNHPNKFEPKEGE